MLHRIMGKNVLDELLSYSMENMQNIETKKHVTRKMCFF